MSKESRKLKKEFIEKYGKVGLTHEEKAKIIIAVIIILIIFSIMFSLLNMNNTRIYKNIFIQGISVSGKNDKEANEMIKNITDEKKSMPITLKHSDFETTISFDQLGIEYDINEAVKDAYNIGRNGNIITNNYKIISTFFKKRNFNLNQNINEDTLNTIINDIEGKLPDVKTESSYYIEDENLIIKKGKEGVIIDKEQLKEKIKNTINDITNPNNTIEIPVENAQPADINLNEIISEVTKQAKNAYISDNPKEIHAEEDGIELAISKEEAEGIIKEDKEEYVIPLKIIQPQITVASLGTAAFTDKLATFTTDFDASNKNRANNLKLASEKLNGTIVNPGETFSYNKTIGERTIAAGFKEANAYSGGDVVLDVGGGICQLSSTLYNAALLTNLEIVERHNHSFKSSYVAAGRDATVSWGSVDFKFKNNRNYPIKIESNAEDGVVTVNIYGIKQDDDYTVLIESKETSVIKQEIEYKEDDTIEKGKEVVERYGENGCTSETYKTLLKNGVVVSKETISKDTYNALSKIIRRNT